MVRPSPIRLASPNVQMIYRVASLLGESLRDRLVFLGGATVSLLLTDEVVNEVRPTPDVDTIIEVTSRTEYDRISEELRGRGFREDIESGIVCRWRSGWLILDVMPTEPEILGFSNRWYPGAIREANTIIIDDIQIRVVSPSYFLATKIEAFLHRGKGQYSTSKDIEDILLLIDGYSELIEAISTSDEAIRMFVTSSLSHFIEQEEFRFYAIPGYLPPDDIGQGRAKIILDRIEKIANLST